MNSSEPAVSPPPADDTAPAGEASGTPGPARAGVVLAFLAALLTGLLASAPARNSDLWRHLAVGRSLAAGQLPGEDALLDAPPGAVPVSSFWLYDVFLYAGFRLLGGPGLVALNACLAALVAVLVFLAGRSGRGTTFAGMCALVASVALGPWLGVTPGLVSCLFLALTLVLLEQVADAAEGESGAKRAWWLLPALVVVWANADVWVLLGPAAVGLAALGEWLRGRFRAARALGILFLLVAVASLVSPNHVRVWATVPEVLRGQPAWGPSISPFWPDWFRGSPPAATLAFYALTALGLLSFAVDRRGSAWTLAPLWAVLLGLALWWPAASPFFAVVAGPTAALGLTALARRAAGARLATMARRLAVIAGVLLVVAAWPGWLQGQSHGRRGWSVEADESLRDAVEQIVSWCREEALGPEARGLTLSLEAAAYWSWFGPDERPTPDGQPSLTGPDSAALWEGLLSGGDGWRDVLRDRRVRFLVLANSASQPAAAVVTRLAAAPREWPLLYLRGRTVVFGWRDPAEDRAADPFAALRLDLEQRAFRPATADRAPAEWPGREPGRKPWWRTFVEPPPPPPPERDEAALYLAFFDAQRPRYQELTRASWLAGTGAGLVGGLADAGRGPAALGGEVGSRLVWQQLGWGAYAAGQDDGPPGLPLLAVRAARRALHDNPDDARSYFLLGEAYLRLGQATREREWRRQLPLFDRIRQLQAITAFTQTLALRPDSPEARGRLARLYRDSGSLDLALRHMGGLRDAVKSRGPSPGETPRAFRERLAPLEEERAALEEEVGRREKEWRESASQGKALDLAREAAARGLPGLALQTLLKSDSSEFGPEGSKLELELLLWEGRVGDVRAWATPELKGILGAVPYHELLARLAAVTGDYDETERHLREAAAAVLRGPGWVRPAREQVASDVARAVLLAPMVDPTTATLVQTTLLRQSLLDDTRQGGAALRLEANANVVRGLIALEAGQVEAARGAMRLALAAWKSPEDVAAGSGIDFTGRPTARQCLLWLEP